MFSCTSARKNSDNSCQNNPSSAVNFVNKPGKRIADINAAPKQAQSQKGKMSFTTINFKEGLKNHSLNKWVQAVEISKFLSTLQLMWHRPLETKVAFWFSSIPDDNCGICMRMHSSILAACVGLQYVATQMFLNGLIQSSRWTNNYLSTLRARLWQEVVATERTQRNSLDFFCMS